MNNEKSVNDIGWWHSNKLSDGSVTPGLKSHELLCEEARHYFDNEIIENKTVLDIGAWDGFMSFEAERRGAKKVLATDHFCWSGDGWGTKDGFDFTHKHTNSKVESLDVDVFDLDPNKQGTFDIVLFLGVLYHLTDPYGGLKKAANMTDDLLIVESTWYNAYPTEPVMKFHLGKELNDDPTNFWSPNELCLRQMLTELGFKKIHTFITPHGRLVAKARKN